MFATFSRFTISALILATVINTSTVSGEVNSNVTTHTGDALNVIGLHRAEDLLDTVSDHSRDVLVYVYSPFCEPCNTFTPIYDQLSSFYTPEERYDKLVLSKIDGPANLKELPFKVLGYPQIMLFTAQAESEPKEYVVQKLDMSAAIGIAKFIETEGTFHIPVPKGLISAQIPGKTPATIGLTGGFGMADSHTEL